MRMKDALMETFEEREGSTGKKEEAEKVDIYSRTLPFSEEIRKRYIQREEQLLADDLPERKERGEQMRWYRRSNRLALTWGWFIEKNCVSGIGALSAEEECYHIINEALSEQGVSNRDDVGTVARIFLWQKSYERVCRFFPFIWEIWKQLPDLLEKMEQEELPLREEEWALLKEWLGVQKKGQVGKTKKNSPYRKMMHCLARGLRNMRGRLKEATEANGSWQGTGHILELETDFCVDEFCRHTFLSFLFWQYCYARGNQRDSGIGKKVGELCKNLLESMRRMLCPGDDFFQLFFNTDYFCFETYGRHVIIPTLNELHKVCGGNTELDLAKLDDFFCSDGKQGGYVRRRERRAGDKDYVWFFRSDFTDEILVWMATNFHFTNEEGKDFFPVQMYLMQAASEEELFLMRYRGVFPDETLQRVLAETRQTRDFFKVPLLIAWMHGE